jgi:hypothetical protein
MSAITDHFEQPADYSVKVWRYMDFAKFVSLISTSKLFFSRVDRLIDSYEGSLSRANVKQRPEFYCDELKDAGISLEGFLEFERRHGLNAKWLRKWTYVNCWHANEHESEAMWKLYGQTNQAVAIQTTYRKLVHALPQDTYVGLVQYIDHENDLMPEGDLDDLYPFFHKRRSLEHEREVRALIQKKPKTKDGAITLRRSNSLRGKSVHVELNMLIENVYVAPSCEQWFFDAVDNVRERFGLQAPLCPSTLDLEACFE